MNDVEKLIKENKRLIDLEASRYSTNLPAITVQIEAYKLAREAARTFQPESGLKFSTHLVNSLKKLSRLSTQYGAVVRVPENTQFAINKLQKLEKDLEHTLGRSPTVDELAHHTGMSISAVVSTLRSKKVSTGLSSMMEAPSLFDSGNSEWVQFVYHDLSDKDKLIFEHKTGFGGKPKLDNTTLAKKVGLSTAVLNSRLKLINETLAKGWR